MNTYCGALSPPRLIPTVESLCLEDLTPVEEYDGIYYKRDDLYVPFNDVPLSGGKVRQACSLILENYEHIRDNCDGLVATPNTLHSPQGIIVTRVAKEFGFRSLVLYGNTNMNSLLENHPLVTYSVHLGAKINCESIQAYDSNTQKHLDRMMEHGLKCFNVKFGINLTTNPNAMMKSIGYQVQNIPNDLDVLVIPCGSCITACGILWGLQEYNKIPQKIYLIQIAGYSREDTINKASNAMNVQFPEFEFIKDKTYPYSKHARRPFGGGNLDPIYEGKAHEYMLKHLDIEGKKVLFWIVGDSQPMRDCAIKHHSTIIEPSDISQFMQAEHFSTEVSQAKEVSDDVTKVTPESDYTSKLTDLQAIADELPDEIEVQRQQELERISEELRTKLADLDTITGESPEKTEGQRLFALGRIAEELRIKLTDLQTINGKSPDKIEVQLKHELKRIDEELHVKYVELGLIKGEPIELSASDKNAIEKLIKEKMEQLPAFKEKNRKFEVCSEGYVKFYVLVNNVDTECFRIYIYNKDYTDCTVKFKRNKRWHEGMRYSLLSECLEEVVASVLTF